MHYLTQSYFLTSTDAAGRMLSWDVLARTEHMEADLADIGREIVRGTQQLAARLGRSASGPYGRGAYWAKREAGASFAPQNKKTCVGCVADPKGVMYEALNISRDSRRALTEQLLEDTETMCRICELYAQDYVCLGYAWPAACRRPACWDTLPPRVRAAVEMAEHDTGSQPEPGGPGSDRARSGSG